MEICGLEVSNVTGISGSSDKTLGEVVLTLQVMRNTGSHKCIGVCDVDQRATHNQHCSSY